MPTGVWKPWPSWIFANNEPTVYNNNKSNALYKFSHLEECNCLHDCCLQIHTVFICQYAPCNVCRASLVGECGSASGVIIIHKLNMAACKRIHVLLKK